MLTLTALVGYGQPQPHHVSATGHLSADAPTFGSPWNLGANNAAGNVKLLGNIVFTGTNPWIIYTPNGGPTSLYVAPNSNFPNATRFDASGNVTFSRRVFIGDVTSPGLLATNTLVFAVGGKIGTRSIFVVAPTTPWPDYVFAPAYRLQPLREVEEFIRAHGHLPDVPSANTVRTEGLDLGATQAILLKKIEELTLCVIDLKKENDRLKERVSTLKN